MKKQKMNKFIIILGLILLSVSGRGQVTSEVTANVGTYYFYTPKSNGQEITFSPTIGVNIKDKFVLNVGLDFIKAYYDTYPYVGVYGEIKRIFKKEVASPFIGVRYGGGLQNNKITGNYFSPGAGIIEHLDKVDLQFSFNLKNHDHYSLRWVHGFEMRLGIIFKN